MSALGTVSAFFALIAVLFVAASGVRAETHKHHAHNHHAHHQHMAHAVHESATGHAVNEGLAGPGAAPARQSHRADRQTSQARKLFTSAQPLGAPVVGGNGTGAKTSAQVPASSGCPVTADPEHCEACPDAAILSLPWQRRDAASAQADRTNAITFFLLGAIAPATGQGDEARPPATVAVSRKHRRSALFARLRL